MNADLELEVKRATAAVLANPLANQNSSIGHEWKFRPLKGKRGGILSNVTNAITALRYAPEWTGVINFNESSLAIVANVAFPLARSASSLVVTRGLQVYKELVALTGIERAKPQFGSVQLGLSACKWVQLVRRQLPELWLGHPTSSLGCHLRAG
jgi:hypothetical protein